MVFAIASKASGTSTRLRPLSFTRKSTLPVFAFCSANRYTVDTDTPYASAILFASCVFSYAFTNIFRASLCSIFFTPMLFYHSFFFVAILENCSSSYENWNLFCCESSPVGISVCLRWYCCVYCCFLFVALLVRWPDMIVLNVALLGRR